MACAGEGLDVNSILQVLHDDDLKQLGRKNIEEARACMEGLASFWRGIRQSRKQCTDKLEQSGRKAFVHQIALFRATSHRDTVAQQSGGSSFLERGRSDKKRSTALRVAALWLISADGSRTIRAIRELLPVQLELWRELWWDQLFTGSFTQVSL